MGFPVIIAAEYGLMFSSPILRFGTQNSLAMGIYGLKVRYGSFSREKPSLSWMRPVWSTIYTYLQGNFHTWIYMIYMGYSKSECYEHVIGRFLAETPCDSLGMQWRQPQAALITQKKICATSTSSWNEAQPSCFDEQHKIKMVPQVARPIPGWLMRMSDVWWLKYVEKSPLVDAKIPHCLDRI